jgi:predicted nuclease with TOPRIM domain
MPELYSEFLRNLSVPSKYLGTVEQVADHIEALQARNDELFAELESIKKMANDKARMLAVADDTNARLRVLESQLQGEVNGLAAHVERLRDAKDSPMEMYQFNEFVVECIEQSPATSLAERDAEVARKSYRKGIADYIAAYESAKEMDYDEMANNHAERVKRGES